MEERLKKIEDRLVRMQHEMTRGHDHLMTVMATQRERIDKAFDTLKTEVRFAMLEQEIALRGEMLILRGGLNDLREGMQEVTQALGDHEQRLQRLEGDQPAA